MELTYLRTFREVARLGSFTKAAEKLGYAQSSVTAQMQKLEREYGVPLVERFGRKLRLTPPGEELLKLTVQMLELFDRSKETIGKQVGGTLTIGTIDSLAAYYLPPYLQQLRSRYPELAVHLQPEREARLLAKVKEGEYDVGLLLDRQPADTALRSIVVREEPLALIAPSGHPLAAARSVEPDDLRGCELIVSEGSCLYRHTFEQLLKSRGVAYRIGLELGSLEAIKQCVASGLGIALLPRIVVAGELQRGTLLELPFAHPDIRFDLQLVIHPDKWMSQPLNALLAMLTETGEA